MNIREFAAIIGCPIETRNVNESYVFDGKTIGSYSEQTYKDKKYYRVDYTDNDLLHEICHYLVAEECQRDLPEYGMNLGLVADAYGPRQSNGRPSKHAWDVVNLASLLA